MTAGSKKVLGRLRLSRSTEESTSLERQREIIQQWADTQGHTVIGWAEDLDVSRSVDPFVTPGLGPWFKPEHLHEWDIVACWRLDRLATGSIYLNKVMAWCFEYEKTLVSVTENFDLSTWVGRLIANVIAGVAEGELEAIKERTRGSRKKLVTDGRWFGGKPTYGYRAVRSGDGWCLEPDPESAPVLRRIVDKAIAGETALAIARQLTEEGVLSPSDFIRHRRCEPTKGTKWSPSTLLDMLKSKSILGQVIHNGNIVRDSSGQPVQVGPPLISAENFSRLQAALAQRAIVQVNKRIDASPLLGVLVCGVCGSNLMYQRQHDKRNGNTRRYYRCEKQCTQQLRAGEVEEMVHTEFIEQLGDIEVLERVYVPAENHQVELEQANQALDELMALVPTVNSQSGRQRLTKQIAAIDAQIQELEQLPMSEARWEYRPTGKTYAEIWAESDTQGRRQLLVKSGIKLSAKLEGRSRGQGGAFYGNLMIPGDILSRMNGGSQK
ncbi:recombinase family protein [Nocardia panacis]|uniref:Recombinase family protein n=1 Tax=Nocardia panacis TaxID=2340916 RepID=A0A3A4KA69_9NOCA|nr:recombinase family protein [Nocardia panacis]RJO74905.1 recombinase family protein [Nocardia panacis]